jgi:hypothetical protein
MARHDRSRACPLGQWLASPALPYVAAMRARWRGGRVKFMFRISMIWVVFVAAVCVYVMFTV